MNCLLNNVANAIEKTAILNACLNKDDFKSYLKNFHINYLTENISYITDKSLQNLWQSPLSAKIPRPVRH